MKHYTKKERQEYVEKWQNTGLSKAAYAETAGISATTFYRWTHETKRAKQSFVEIPQGKFPSTTREIVIEKDSLIIRLPLSSGIKELQTLFIALEGIK